MTLSDAYNFLLNRGWSPDEIGMAKAVSIIVIVTCVMFFFMLQAPPPPPGDDQPPLVH